MDHPQARQTKPSSQILFIPYTYLQANVAALLAKSHRVLEWSYYYVKDIPQFWSLFHPIMEDSSTLFLAVFYLMNMDVLLTCESVHHIHAWYLRRKSDFFKLRLQMVANLYIGSRKRT